MSRSGWRIWLGIIVLLWTGQRTLAQQYPTAIVTISGVQTGSASGTMTIGFNGYSQTVPYGPFSTASSIASAFADKFSADPVAELHPRLCTNGICAKATGPVILIQLKLTSSFGSFNLSSTGPSPFQASVTSTTARPLLNWPSPSAISYGVPLSAAQLDAIANVPGSFVYSPAEGTILSVGTQTLSVLFTPTDTTDYTVATGSVPITVNISTVPVISTIEPTSVPVGAVANIGGVNFGIVPGLVSIDGLQVQQVYWSSSIVSVIVPNGASAGSLILTTANGNSANATVNISQTVQSCPVP